jgi:hypothetical protein
MDELMKQETGKGKEVQPRQDGGQAFAVVREAA